MRLLLTSFVFICAISFCNAQFAGYTVELDTMFLEEGSDLEFFGAYRVYANFTNQNDALSALYSDVGALGTPPMFIDAPCGCYNPVDGSPVMDATNSSALWSAFPEYEFDTYWTIGVTSGDAAGQLPNTIGMPAGNEICSGSTETGAVFAIGIPPNALAGEELRVLIAQVTTCGDWSLQTCVQTFVNTDQTNLVLTCPELLEVIHPYLDGECINDSDGDGVCDEFEICDGEGIPEGECDCFGTLPDAIDECGGSCENDINNNGICDLFDTGCLFSNACNYDPVALFDDGSCVFYCPGCTDAVACNYDAYFLQDDGSCVYPGCNESAACNYDSAAGCYDGSCLYFDECGICGGAGTLGCTDAIACNYDISAECDDGSCLYFDECGICGGVGTLGCTTLGACNYDNSAACDDTSCEYTSCAGCQYEFACNYDAEATIADNASCEFGTCPGCTDFSACNYNPTLTEDDGSCEYCSCISVTPIIADFGDGLIIPDDQGQCFLSQINVTSFNSVDVVNDGNIDIENLFINFEHSYMGDLTITLICPSGQGVLVHQQGGGGTFLGVPVDNDALPDDPGIGFDYWWEPGATNGTWVDNAGGATLPSGVYESVQPFTNLNGCPLNGTWSIEVCDIFPQDNGFIFEWSIEASDLYETSDLYFDESCDCDGDGNVLDECGVCGGDGIPEGDCDCYGNILDECGVCGGLGIPEGDCDCEGNILDATGICGGDCEYDFNSNGVCDDQEVYGCTYPDSPSYDASATADDGSCVFYIIDNFCPADLDFNGSVGSPDLLLFLSAYGDICG
jgi:subtilisin-like proprotein convertase family protein